MVDDCLFCQFVQGEKPCHKIWEDENYLAFLTIFPNTKGATVVIPKRHYDSYAFEVPENVMLGLTKASKKVGRLLDESFDDVDRTAMVYEGYGVNHLHVKLFPMHGTDQDQWEPIKSDIDTYFEEYPGYISSHDSKRMGDEKLEQIAKQIKKNA